MIYTKRKAEKKILLGLSAELLKNLDRQARREHLYRTGMIRKAIENYLIRISFEDEARARCGRPRTDFEESI